MPRHGAALLVLALAVAGCAAPATDRAGEANSWVGGGAFDGNLAWKVWEERNATGPRGETVVLRILVARIGEDSWLLRQEPENYTWWVNRTVIHRHAAVIECADTADVPDTGTRLWGRCDVSSPGWPNEPPWVTTVDLTSPALWRADPRDGWSLLEFRLTLGGNGGGAGDVRINLCRQEGAAEERHGQCTRADAGAPQFYNDALAWPVGLWSRPGAYGVWAEPAGTGVIRGMSVELEVAAYCCATLLPTGGMHSQPYSANWLR